MKLLELPTEFLMMVVDYVVNRDLHASPHLQMTATMEWTHSISLLVLVSQLALTNRKLRDLVYSCVLSRRTTRFLRLWPLSGSLWSKTAVWHRSCHGMVEPTSLPSNYGRKYA